MLSPESALLVSRRRLSAYATSEALREFALLEGWDPIHWTDGSALRAAARPRAPPTSGPPARPAPRGPVVDRPTPGGDPA